MMFTLEVVKMDSLDIMKGYLTNLGIHSDFGRDNKLYILDIGEYMDRVIRKCQSFSDIRFVCERRPLTTIPFSCMTICFIEVI